MERNDFFREFTSRICSSLNVGEALWRCVPVVRRILPADEMMLTAYDPATGALEIIARADQKGFVADPKDIPIPPGLRHELEHTPRYRRARITNDARQDPIIKEVGIKLEWPSCSAIVVHLIVQHEFIGSLIVRASGLNRYSEEHGELCAAVSEPLAIALANSRQYRELRRLKEAVVDDNRYLDNKLRKNIGSQIIGVDFGLKDVMNQVYRVAPLVSPVLLIGETGSGKEIIANAIHNLSPRNCGPLVAVNCGAIPESLMDSELFGHVKGAFTGALTDRKGRFERAHGGTIFLDEVGELPLHAQVRLLRVLQEKEVERVGGSRATKVDIRIISAAHRSLENLVAEGLFRKDLYYRLRVYPILIPPLRERKADIPALVEYLMQRKARELGFRERPALPPGVIDRLTRHDWPGNVRELSNVIERALIQSRGKCLDIEDADLPAHAGVMPAKTANPEVKQLPLSSASEDRPQPREIHLKLNEVEARHIRKVIVMTGGRIEGKCGAAAVLGINPATLRYRMQKLGISFRRAEKVVEKRN